MVHVPVHQRVLLAVLVVLLADRFMLRLRLPCDTRCQDLQCELEEMANQSIGYYNASWLTYIVYKKSRLGIKVLRT